jgi:hypothetical protein
MVDRVAGAGLAGSPSGLVELVVGGGEQVLGAAQDDGTGASQRAGVVLDPTALVGVLLGGLDGLGGHGGDLPVDDAAQLVRRDSPDHLRPAAQLAHHPGPGQCVRVGRDRLDHAGALLDRQGRGAVQDGPGLGLVQPALAQCAGQHGLVVQAQSEPEQVVGPLGRDTERQGHADAGGPAGELEGLLLTPARGPAERRVTLLVGEVGGEGVILGNELPVQVRYRPGLHPRGVGLDSLRSDGRVDQPTTSSFAHGGDLRAVELGDEVGQGQGQVRAGPAEILVRLALPGQPVPRPAARPRPLSRGLELPSFVHVFDCKQSRIGCQHPEQTESAVSAAIRSAAHEG